MLRRRERRENGPLANQRCQPPKLLFAFAGKFANETDEGREIICGPPRLVARRADLVAERCDAAILSAIGREANHRMVICSVRTRPNRSANIPAAHPPNADVNSVTVPISPASTLVIENVAIIAGIAKLKIATSKASSAHPPKQAHNVRLSLGAARVPLSVRSQTSIRRYCARHGSLRLALTIKPNQFFNRRAVDRPEDCSTRPSAPSDRLSLPFRTALSSPENVLDFSSTWPVLMSREQWRRNRQIAVFV